jgi:CubicO group peptidase (beta-lactamase class C family)
VPPAASAVAILLLGAKPARLTRVTRLRTIADMKRLVSTVALLSAVFAGPVLTAGCGSDGTGSRVPTFEVPGAAGPGATAAPGATTPVTPGSPAPGATTPGGSELGGPGEVPVVGQMPVTPPSASSGATFVALPRSTPEAEGISSQSLLTFVTALDDSPIELHSLMIARHGKVVAEGWWAPYTSEDIHVTYSVTKSFNGTAVGLAIQEGLLGLDDTLVSHFPELTPASASPNLMAMRVRDLLTMSTGHAADTIDRLRARTDGQWTRAFLELPVENPPGAPFIYNSGAAYMLSSLVQKVTGTSVKDYLTPRLFAPLGIASALWGVSAEGVNLGDGGLSLRTEDLLKFGLLYLQQGQWNGEQILSQQWVTDATRSEVSNGAGESNWNAGYGFQFWRNQSTGYRADGSLGQFIFVLPDQDAVISVTSATTDLAGVMNLVFGAGVPTLAGVNPLPENAAAQQALKDKLATFALPAPTGTTDSALSADVSGRVYTTAANSYGVTSVQLDFAATPNPVVTITDADGPHAIPVGLGDWVRSRTGYRKRINELFDTPEQGIAARGAWTDANTFTTKIVFNETPYAMTTTYRFDGEQVSINSSYNVRWGNATESPITGTR